MNKYAVLKRIIIIGLISILLGCTPTTKKVGDNETTTRTQSLADQWQFKTDSYEVGIEQGWWLESLDTEHWDTIAVPGVWDVYDQYHDYTGTAWYRYQFQTENHNDSDKVQLHFDSVYHDSTVWLNGKKLGENKLGFMAFKFDVSKHLKPNQTNTLVLQVNNRVKRGAVWNWGGIRFPVYLTYQPKSHLERVYVTSTPDLQQGTAKINVRTTVNSEIEKLQQAQLQLNVSRAGEPVYQTTKPVLQPIIDDNGLININHDFELSEQHVALWNFNHPNLYDITASLLLEGKAHHQISDRFGIRKVETKQNGLYLNGERIRLNGFNMVPEDRFDGNALPLSRIKQDVDLLKTLNGNFARLSGPALPEAYLDYLDEVGFLLIEEVGLWGKDKLVDPDHPLPKEWLRRLVDDHYNHPSIIGWSVGNEIGDLKKNPKALEYVSGAIQHSKQLDPNRLAVYISYSADYQQNDPTMYSDIVMFNKYGEHEQQLQKVHEFHPDKAIFYSEIGTKLDGVDPNESTLDPQGLWNGLKKYPYLIGTSHFAFSDYRSDWKDAKASWTTDLSENRAWGVLTAYRTPKRSFEKLRNFNAPVEAFSLEPATDDSFKLTLTPKGTNTFPAFKLSGYHIVWLAEGDKGQVQHAGGISLGEIPLGSEPIANFVEISSPFNKLTANLVDPLGYIVKQDVLYSDVPKTPAIKSVFSSLDTIRVTFDKTTMAEEHLLEAIDANGKVYSAKPTINSFAEVTGLEADVAYQLSLTAINPLGKSKAFASAQPVKTTPAELPPIIWSVLGKEDAFHIGFSVFYKDFKYEIEYGLAPGQYSKRFIIDTHGATRIPAIESGNDHYFRLRRLITGRTDSEWTEEYKVAMPTDIGIHPPLDAYIFKGDKSTLLGLTPVQGATGYRLKWKENGKFQTVDTKLAYSTLLLLENGIPLTSDVQIATIDNDGKVGSYSDVRLVKAR